MQPGAAGLVGGQGPSPMPDQRKQNEAFVGQIRQWNQELDDFARQFPAFSKYAGKAKDALIEGMTRTMAAQQRSQPAQQAPPIAG
jgi:hypothetical protein